MGQKAQAQNHQVTALVVVVVVVVVVFIVVNVVVVGPSRPLSLPPAYLPPPLSPLRSACQLPKPLEDERSGGKGEIIDPFVKVKIYGVRVDRRTQATDYVLDNGFNPQVVIIETKTTTTTSVLSWRWVYTQA